MTEEDIDFSLYKSYRLGFCGCGCWELTTFYKGKFRKYILGHQPKRKHKGRFLTNGYWTIYKPDYFGSYDNGCIQEHVFVFQEYHKCCMLPWGNIHHIDGHPERENANRIENLHGMMKGQHSKIHRTKDLSNRVCLKCRSKTTYIHKKNGCPNWFKHEDGFLCELCYKRNKLLMKKISLSIRVNTKLNI